MSTTHIRPLQPSHHQRRQRRARRAASPTSEILERIERCWLARLEHASGGLPDAVGGDISRSC